jgi:hypothetical protein
MTWYAYGLNLLLYGLAAAFTLASGVREAMQLDNTPLEPVMVYTNEAGIWLRNLPGLPQNITLKVRRSDLGTAITNS